MAYRLSINANNIAAISSLVSYGQFLTKQGTLVKITWSMMRQMASLIKSRNKIKVPDHLWHLSAFVDQKTYDEIWQFDSSAGLVFQIDQGRNCLQIFLGDGNCIEIDVPILLELKRRYNKTSYV